MFRGRLEVPTQFLVKLEDCVFFKSITRKDGKEERKKGIKE